MAIFKGKSGEGCVKDQWIWVGSKKHALSLSEGPVQQGFFQQTNE